ncbi:Phosphatidylinositol 3-kinase, Vps34 type [Carpediemonas membranifera]|uniref:phosphatidylinositol 3-kinase n=1 Tax=Carpediemonas membranifera TaxID=201153 RepID=A0A8J6AS27_9EUKA|nr:Phosphatidylinositol 3-kinase, Vps34 type [Carpediemonas membranifera]|eukprot:KAG9392971.1 Phosphatidylinositol 3-kinase, Vps34 type [Carpediemonas membranifera]
MSDAGGRYFYTADVKEAVTIKIEALEGDLHSLLNLPPEVDIARERLLRRSPACLVISAQLLEHGIPLTQATVTEPAELHETEATWGTTVCFDMLIRDTPLHCMAAFTVWDVSSPSAAVVVGGTTVPVFSRKNLVQCGKVKLRMHPGRVADCGPQGTPGLTATSTELNLTEKILKAHGLDKKGRPSEYWVKHDGWLNQLTAMRIQQLARAEVGGDCGLIVSFPETEHRVVFMQDSYQEGKKSRQSYFGGLAPTLPVDPACNTQDPQPAPEENFFVSVERILADSGTDARGRQPTSKERQAITDYLRAAPSRPPTELQAALCWGLRYWLSSNPAALPRFLRIVDWTDPAQVAEAEAVVAEWRVGSGWQAVTMLELLTPQFAEMAPWVRALAARQFRTAHLDVIELFIPQLAHAARFDHAPLSDHSIGRAVVDRCCVSLDLATRLYWVLSVEAASPNGEVFAAVLDYMLERLDDYPETKADILGQRRLVEDIEQFTAKLRANKESRPRRIELMREMVAANEFDLGSRPPVTLPLLSDRRLTGFDPTHGHIFKSAKQPMRLDAISGGNHAVPVMVKCGDDVRQDQLVLQLLQVMDRLLKKENLDLCLTPYGTIATSPTGGMVELVTPSVDLDSVLRDSKSITRYFQSIPALREKDGDRETWRISEEAMSRYVRSCAGYCVATYLLGVGDRHLENIMLKPDAKLFHIDFGFILGRDPKPFSPPMKISRAMVDGMGGPASPQYQEFQTLCCEAYNILRRHANMFISVFEIMSSSSIAVICEDAVNHFAKLEEKFQFGLPDERAVEHFRSLIQESVGALFPQIFDAAHRIAQALRT